MSDIENAVTNAIDIIDRFEDLFAAGKPNDANNLITENAPLLSKTLTLIINCFITSDPEDKSGFINYYTGLMKNILAGLQSNDMFYKSDIFCYYVRNGLVRFMEVIG